MASIEQQRGKAELLRQLHQGSLQRAARILVLTNAWDALSARVFESEGFAAIGTTSAGVSYSLGYTDGENVPREEMLAATARIARCVAVPVTADIEAGFGESLEELRATIRGVVGAGAVGINLEDRVGTKLVEIGTQLERIRAVRETAASLGVPLVLNARTDVYALLKDIALTVERLNAYRDAGADCLFAPGVVDRETIAALVREVRGPLNVLAWRGTPPIGELESLGVARVSVGSGPCRAAAAFTQRIARELRSAGTYELFTENAIPYAEMNRLMG
jgi:2-methylisocitrate lyase-like PEP mutase family enzyme